MKITLIIVVISCLLNACKSDSSRLYSGYTRQIKETILILEQKSDLIYVDFESLHFEFKVKIAPLYQKSIIVKKSKDSIIHLLDEILDKIHSTGSSPDNISKVEDIILIRQFMKGYKNTLISLIVDTSKYAEVMSGIEKTLSVEDLDVLDVFKSQAAKPEKREACIWKIKSDIVIAETQILNYLYSQFDAGNFRFSNINAFIVPNSQMLPLGYPYRAEIFLASYDSTISAVFEIEGEKYETTSGIGIYKKLVPKKPGSYSKNGNFMIKSPYTGEIRKIPFKIEYEIMEEK